MLPMPNQSMNTGTQASEGIGIRALASGSTKCSTARKRPIRMPSGMPATTASDSPNITRYSVAAAWPAMLPSASDAMSALAICGSVGISAGANHPERASAS